MLDVQLTVKIRTKQFIFHLEFHKNIFTICHIKNIYTRKREKFKIKNCDVICVNTLKNNTGSAAL